MIDNTEKTEALMERIRAALPIGAEIPAQVHRALRNQSPHLALPRRCRITAVYYAGDEGGIVCTLDFGSRQTENVHIVSITHLNFDRADPLSRDIRVYQQHRVKRLRQLDGRPFLTG